MLVLPLMRHLLCDESCLVLPDFSLAELKSFIKILYGGGNRFIHFTNLLIQGPSEKVIKSLFVSIRGSATSLKKIGAVFAALGQHNTAVSEVGGKSEFHLYCKVFSRTMLLPVRLSPCHRPNQRSAL